MYTLSETRYGITRVVKYLQLLLLIALLFVPIFQVSTITYISYDVAAIDRASISVVQFIANTASINYHGNVVEAVFEELPQGMLLFFRFGCVLIGLFVAFINHLSSNYTPRNSNLNAQNELYVKLERRRYITKVYNTLPPFFEFIEKMLFGTILGAYLLFNMVGYALMQGGMTNWTIHLLPSLIVLIVLILLANGMIINIIAAKDMRAIRDQGLRFDEPYEKHTLLSDIQAVLGLIGFTL